MIFVKNLQKWDGTPFALEIPSTQNWTLDGTGLTCLPALIDPHVHFRVPGDEYKEDWSSASLAAIRAGIAGVCEMPNNKPSCCTVERLRQKKQQIESQLQSVGMPLKYGLYLGADKNHLEEISRVGSEAVAVKVFMGCSTGDLLIDTDRDLEEVFRRAAEARLLVAVHAEDESILCARKKLFAGNQDPAVHSRVRPPEAAVAATSKVIELAAKFNTPLYILHLSTKEELELVRQAKKSGVPIYAEVTTHHLFFTEKDYTTWGTLVQMNPPIRTQEDQDALWEGVRDGTVDTIGTDHAPHTLEEKKQPYGKAPSGIPGIETLLPLMLDAVSKKRLSLERLIALTRFNVETIFKLQPSSEWVLVDLEMEKTVSVENLRSKCGWSPYCGRRLKGWPIYTILGEKIFPASGFGK